MDTKTRLLEAAADAFAEKGYGPTTVRDIVARAGANLASVNYHFGDKAALYQAAQDYARQQANAENPYVQADTHRNFHADKPADQRLYLYIRTMVGHILRGGEPTRMTRLMLHEMIQPTPALDRLITLSVRRVYEALKAILRDLLPPGAEEDQVRALAYAVNAQIHMLHVGRAFHQRLEPQLSDRTEADLDRIAQEIHTVVMSSIRGAST